MDIVLESKTVVNLTFQLQQLYNILDTGMLKLKFINISSEQHDFRIDAFYVDKLLNPIGMSKSEYNEIVKMNLLFNYFGYISITNRIYEVNIIKNVEKKCLEVCTTNNEVLSIFLCN